MRSWSALAALMFTACTYHGGFAFHDAEFAGARVAFTCLDLAVARQVPPASARDDRGLRFQYELGNRCDAATRVDLASVRVVAKYDNGRVAKLTARDPGGGLRAWEIDGRRYGSEAIEYVDASAGSGEVGWLRGACVDVGRIDGDGGGGEHWLCFGAAPDPAELRDGSGSGSALSDAGDASDASDASDAATTVVGPEGAVEVDDEPDCTTSPPRPSLLDGTRCERFAAWSTTTRVPELFTELGVEVRGFTAPLGALSATATHFDALTIPWRFGVRVHGPVYAGAELELGGLLSASEDGSPLWLSADGFVGARGGLGPVSVAAEIAVGGWGVFASADAKSDASVLADGALLEARVRAEVWASPWIAVGVNAGAGIDGATMAGMSLRVGTRAFAGDRHH